MRAVVVPMADPQFDFHWLPDIGALVVPGGSGTCTPECRLGASERKLAFLRAPLRGRLLSRQRGRLGTYSPPVRPPEGGRAAFLIPGLGSAR